MSRDTKSRITESKEEGGSLESEGIRVINTVPGVIIKRTGKRKITISVPVKRK